MRGAAVADSSAKPGGPSNKSYYSEIEEHNKGQGFDHYLHDFNFHKFFYCVLLLQPFKNKYFAVKFTTFLFYYSLLCQQCETECATSEF